MVTHSKLAKIIAGWLWLLLAVGASAQTAGKYVALGDSLAYGTGASYGYVPRYWLYVHEDSHLTSGTLLNLGHPGDTSADLLDKLLRNHHGERDAVASAQIVTLDIGGNDALNAIHAYLGWGGKTCGGWDNQNCFRRTLTSFKSNWDGILREILSLRSKQTTIIRVMDIYNPAAGSKYAAVYKPYIDAMNDYIRKTASENGIPCARVYFAFNGPSGIESPESKGLMSRDGIHPNDAGHKLIANLLRQLKYAPLSQSE